MNKWQNCIIFKKIRPKWD